MTGIRVLGALLLAAATAVAAPVTLTQAGHLVDHLDQPVQGEVQLAYTMWSHVVASDDNYRVWPATGTASCLPHSHRVLQVLSKPSGQAVEGITSARVNR